MRTFSEQYTVLALGGSLFFWCIELSTKHSTKRQHSGSVWIFGVQLSPRQTHPLITNYYIMLSFKEEFPGELIEWVPSLVLFLPHVISNSFCKPHTIRATYLNEEEVDDDEAFL